MEELHAPSPSKSRASPSLLTPWTFEPLQIVPTLIVALLYLRRTRTLARARASRCPAGGRSSFWTGIGLVVLALNSPIDALGEEHFFFVHMLQHVVLGDLAPLCFVVGLTGPILRPVLALRARRAAARPRASARRAAGLGASTSTSGTSRSSTTPRCTTTPVHALEHFLLLHVRLPDVGAGRRDAAGARVVRHRREDRLHLRRAADRDGARQRLHVVELRCSTASTGTRPSGGSRRRTTSTSAGS